MKNKLWEFSIKYCLLARKFRKILKKLPQMPGRAENEKWTVGIFNQSFSKRAILMADMSGSCD
jgi:hypothetical protein